MFQILIVEDDKELSKLFQKVLEKNGYQVKRDVYKRQPRNYAFNFRHFGDMKNHYAIIGMAHVAEDYPLYYDAMHEKGVAMAGLNFVGNAV